MFLTQIIDGQATELALCEECAKAKGIFDPQSLTFAEKFFPEEFRKRVDKLIHELTHADAPAAVKSTPPQDSLTQCPTCRFTLEDYRQTGRFGCPDCYGVFAGETGCDAGEIPIADATATAPVPPQNPAALRRTLEQQLEAAVQREDYEEAARLRDRIRELG